MDKLILLNKYILKLVILYESKWVSEEVSKLQTVVRISNQVLFMYVCNLVYVFV